MVTVSEAIKIIESNTKPLIPVKIPLSNASGKILATSLMAVADFPPFPQSSMDGYALRFSDFSGSKPLIIEGEMAAGVNENLVLPIGKTARIFTGAPLPEGADTVVMQEKVSMKTDEEGRQSLLINDENLVQGANVRPKGSEIRKGAPALEENILLTPAAIGFLVGIGFAEVLVISDPKISLIITGKELQETGKPLQFGQVYESNSLTLSAALKQIQLNADPIFRADDNIDEVTECLKNALEQSDMVLLSGGISAGVYDFVLQATENCGVEKLFHKVKQRPGKPLYFGKKEDKLVFGLPGNPSSVLTCFYEYVLPAIGLLTKRNVRLKSLEVPLLEAFHKSVSLTHFLKGIYNGTGVEILGAQESFKLNSFAKANCLVKIGEETMAVKKGENVEIHLLP